ncbi:hypothetical protein ERX37_08000 [Macrococcus hajekii]|uniref:DUF771 domain-containing protein n=1 Tax=Macrococcus hajekii TaxID=198482 RepID=A0A4R6BJ44_9STAP|nr:hypothetical protein ERX37_08000 [Macrococcus hajekii]
MKKALPSQEYVGFADTDEFQRISGISDADLKKKVYPNAEFKKRFIRRFPGSRKRYIKIKPAIDYIWDYLLEGE